MMRVPRLRLALAVVAALALLALAVWAVGESRIEAQREAERERPVTTPQRVFVENGETVLRIDPATLARSGIGVAPLAASSGRTADPVFATVVDVTRLTDLKNAWTTAHAQEVAALARAKASKAAYERTKLLYADAQNASLAQLQAAQATYAADQAGVAAAETQTAAALASARQEFGPALMPGSSLVAALISRRELLVQIVLPPDARSGPPTLAVIGDGGVKTIGHLIGPAARADPRVPGRGIYYAVSGSSGLVPGMNVTAEVPVGPTAGGATVPPSAVVEWQGRSWLYRRNASGTFSRVPVETEQRDTKGNYIVHDLAPGTPVAVRGAQLLLSEELRTQSSTESDEG